MLCYVVDESTTLSEQDLWNAAWALDYQLRFQFGRSGWRSDVSVSYVPKNVAPTIKPGSIILHILDSLDVQGALGYHDEDGNEVPYAKIGVSDTQADGQHVSEVLSHEGLELAADPHVNDTCLDKNGTKLYAKEVGDPCQGNGYDVGAPEGRTTGVIVADFALPNYFDPNTPTTVKTDYRGALTGPFVVGPQGYMAYIDLMNLAAGWQQVFGERAHKVPDPDDRARQRLVKQVGITS